MLRIGFVVAVLAITGSCGAAVADSLVATSLLEPAGTPAVTALVDTPATPPPTTVKTSLQDLAAPGPRVQRLMGEATDVLRKPAEPTGNLVQEQLLRPLNLDFDATALVFALLPDDLVRLDVAPTALGGGATSATPTLLVTAAPLPASRGPATHTPLPPAHLGDQRMAGHAGTYAPTATPTGGDGPVRTQTASTPTYPAIPLQAWVVGGTLAAGLLGLLGLTLYSRIRPNATLENETRKQIFEAVCQHPGLGVHAIAKTSGVSYSTATYHLERLVAAGMLVMTPDGNKLCYYKNGGAFTEAERRILPLVKNEEASKLLEAILDTPGTYRAALAERLGVTATTINWHLRRLREAGLVDETRQGRNAYLYIRADEIRRAFPTLAEKIGPEEGATADRLRQLAALAPEPTGAA